MCLCLCIDIVMSYESQAPQCFVMITFGAQNPRRLWRPKEWSSSYHLIMSHLIISCYMTLCLPIVIFAVLYTIISSRLSSPVFCPPFYSILLLSYQSCDSSVYHITSYIIYHITISCLSPRIDPPQIDIIYHTVIRTCTLDISLRHGQLPLLLDNRHK